MGQEPFSKISVALAEQYRSAANDKCRECDFVTSSAELAAKLLDRHSFTDIDDLVPALEELAKTDPEALRLLSNLEATYSCMGSVAADDICRLDSSK